MPIYPKWFARSKARTLILSILGVFASTLVLLFLHQFILPVVAWFLPQFEIPFYDLGVYGSYRTRNYVSYDLSSPRVSHLQWDNQCDDGFVLITPHGADVDNAGPMILDARGELVWMSEDFGPVWNLKAQKYKNETYLTFWAGEKQGSYGAGDYYMLDATYQVVYQIDAMGEDLHADLHELIITDEGTALISVYNVTQTDLTSIGRPVNGWINDSIFQEIDIATGELLFQWKASDHFRPDETYYVNPFAGYSKTNPFDLFHINSIQKDADGNYLVSARHNHAITTISHETGEPLWVLGGKRNEFKDLSDGAATAFSWQHDARWVSEAKGILTLFDNGYAGPIQPHTHSSQGLMLQLDISNRTTTLLNSYTSLQQLHTPSQGSMQVLHGDNGQEKVFIGWGHSAAYTEYHSNGTLLCETHFGASWLYYLGRVVSYRAQKTTDWIGAPTTSPAAAIRNGMVYVSWNGATEVVAWELQGVVESDENEGDENFRSLDITDRSGFESAFLLPLEDYTRFRVLALDRNGQTLGCSDVIESAQSEISIFDFFGMVGFLGALSLCVSFLCRRIRRLQRAGVAFGYRALDDKAVSDAA